ncbi:MAG TPA: acyl-[acyl-carrier-protein]--UDP-N-acetylglucosamine O-acyltransferase [Deltaproteobacteria bacterium]|nr:acyl-[acyl-carrier-protein]--UDP-N-acetylglucosamine O-acyltransferase [Deltaproteobacteria bacterium]
MQGQGANKTKDTNLKSSVLSLKSAIHPTAIIHPNAEIGECVEVGPYSVIGENVRIGDDVKIYPHVVIDGWTTIGKGCSIYQFTSIGAPPQDLKFGGEASEVIIGENNTIREFVTINRATSHGGGKTIIGNNNLLMAYVHIAHDCKVGNNVILANAATLAGHIEISDHSIIGGLVAIHQFARIGCYSIIGGASAVTHDIPPYVMAVGNRARLYGLNKLGLKRHGFSVDEIKEIKEAYDIIFRSGLMLEEALKKVREELKDSKHVNTMIEFIRNSKRGITRPRSKKEEGDETGED